MQAQSRCHRFEAVVEPYSRRRRGCCCSSAATEEVETGVEGRWRHVGEQGGAAEVSALVVGRSRVAYLGKLEARHDS